jgi:hypothetical protein
MKCIEYGCELYNKFTKCGFNKNGECFHPQAVPG